MRRVLALAALASLAVVAWTIFGGAAGALYAAAAGLALVGLLLPPALKRQRSGRDGRRDSPQPAPERNTNEGAGTSRSRLLPGVRRLSFVRELEADLAGERGENRALRERLGRELEELQRANELLEDERALHEKALRRVEDGLERHRRARSLLEREVEAIHALLTSRATGPQTSGLAATNPTAAAQPLDGGLRPAQV